MKLIRLILFPFLSISSSVFLFLNFLPVGQKTFLLAIIVGVIVSGVYIYLDRPIQKAEIRKKNLLPFLAITILFTSAIAWVTSPAVTTKTVSGHQFLSVNSLGDYYKHLFVTSAISQTGLPPAHPYFPPAKLSYYYGYYLIPSAVSSAFQIDIGLVFYLYFLTTIFVILLSVCLLSLFLIKKAKLAFLAFLLVIFGTGLDLIPTMIETNRGLFSTMHHIELWSYLLKVRYVVSNPFVELLWVPQHFFAALIALVASVSLLAEEKISKFWLFLAVWFVSVSSIFVAFTLAIWISLIFIFKKKTRVSILVPCLVAFFVLIPFLAGIRDRGNLLSFGFYMQPYEYLPNIPIIFSVLLEILTEYGILIFAFPLFLFSQNNYRLRWLIALGVGIPILVPLFVQSSGYAGVNDFAMRVVLPSQIALAILFVIAISGLKSTARRVIILLTMANLILSFGGFGYEMIWRWKERKLLDLTTSELLLNLRNHPIDNILVLKSEEWSYLIPSYAYLPITGPGLFDAAVYISGTDGLVHGEFEGWLNRTFNDPTLGSTPEDVVSARNQSLKNLTPIIESLPNKNLITPIHRWVKGGLEPWTAFFSTFAPGKPVSSEYLVFETNVLRSAILGSQVTVPMEKITEIDLKDGRRFVLDRGFWFIIACDDTASLKFELEDYYTLFEVRGDEGTRSCAGEIFYQAESENVLISSRSRFKDFYVAPLEINKPK